MAGIALALAWTGCGGGTDPPNPEEVYRGQLEDVCAERERELHLVDGSTYDGFSYTTPSGDVHFGPEPDVGAALASRRQAAQRLEALSPPPALADAHRRLVGAEMEGVRLSAALVNTVSFGSSSGTALTEPQRAAVVNLIAANQLARDAVRQMGVSCTVIDEPADEAVGR